MKWFHRKLFSSMQWCNVMLGRGSYLCKNQLAIVEYLCRAQVARPACCWRWTSSRSWPRRTPATQWTEVSWTCSKNTKTCKNKFYKTPHSDWMKIDTYPNMWARSLRQTLLQNSKFPFALLYKISTKWLLSSIKVQTVERNKVHKSGHLDTWPENSKHFFHLTP